MGRRRPTGSIAAMIRDCPWRGAEPAVRRLPGVSVTYPRDHRSHLVFLILAVLLARVPDLFYHYQDWDEAAMMSQAWAMTQGQVLYRDTFQIHPVLNFAIFYPFFRLLPADAAAHAVKLFNLVLVALGAFGVYALVRRWTGDPWAALLAGTLLAHYLGSRWGLSSYGEFYILLPVLATAWLLFVRERTSTPSLVLVGALWSLSFFIKQVALLDAAALYLSYLLFDGARPFRKLASSFAMGLGALGVAAAVGGYLLSKETLALAIQSTLVRPMTHYAQLAPGASQGLARSIWELSRRETAGLLAAIKVLPVPLLAAICAPAMNCLFDRFSLRTVDRAGAFPGRTEAEGSLLRTFHLAHGGPGRPGDRRQFLSSLPGADSASSLNARRLYRVEVKKAREDRRGGGGRGPPARALGLPLRKHSARRSRRAGASARIQRDRSARRSSDVAERPDFSLSLPRTRCLLPVRSHFE